MAQAKPLLLTGAAGALGTWLRPHLVKRPGGLRSSDIKPFGPALPGEEIVTADVADGPAMDRLVAGTGAIVHLGAVSVEDSFDKILQGNIIGTYNVFEAARQHGVKRIVYASSNHAIGYWPSGHRLDADVAHRPDSYYGVSKAFGEDLAWLYVQKAGLEIACLRIGSATPVPTLPRHLSTWLSYPDLLRLIEACLDAPKLDFSIVYGASNNRRTWWDNSKSGIDYRPQDDAETYAAKLIPDGDKRNPEDPAVKYQGGHFMPLKLGQRPE